MSDTEMLSTNALAVSNWEKQTAVQNYQYSSLGLLEEKGAIFIPKEIGNGYIGTNTTFAYAGKLTAKPIGEGGTLSGNAEGLDLTSHSMTMNVTRFGVQSPTKNTVEQTRTHVNFDSVAMKQIRARSTEFLDTSVLYHLAGAAPTSLTINGTTYSTASELLHVQGHNTPVAPSSERVIRAGGVANDQSLTSAHTFRLDFIDAALEAAALSSQPLQMFDDGTFALILSPEQATDLIRDSAGKSTWYTMQIAKMQGGKPSELMERKIGDAGKGMIYLGRYANVHIYQAPRVAYGVNGSSSAVITTVRRAVLVGADAISFASQFGGGLSEGGVVKLFSEEVDVGYFKINEARMIYGVKKMIPTNKQDIGVITIATYAAAHSA